MRVLFIEDNPMNRQVVRDMLSVGGVEMDEASSGRVGLDKLNTEDYDLVLIGLADAGNGWIRDD